MIRGLDSVGLDVDVETTLTDDERKQRLDDLTALIDMIRPAVQQEEMEARGAEFLEMFRGRSPQFKELLQDVKPRTPDVVFDREVKLDLGGVTAHQVTLTLQRPSRNGIDMALINFARQLD